MFLGELNLDLLHDISCVSLESSIEGSSTIYDNESEFVIIFKEDLEGFSVEFVITEIEELVNRLEGLKIKGNFLFSFTIFH